MVRDLAIAIANRGHQVDVGALRRFGDLGGDPLFEEQMTAELAAQGIRSHWLCGPSRSFSLLSVLRLRRLLRSVRPDVVHIHLQAALGIQLLSGSRVPTVYTHHIDRYRLGALAFRLVSSRVAAIVGISPDIADMLRRTTRVPVVMIRNAIRDRAEPPGADICRDGPFQIISVGRTHPQKNYALLLKVARAATQVGLDCVFTVVGGGPELESLRRDVARDGLGDRIHLLGTRTDVPHLLSQADAYLLTSLYEGLPIALIEAAMAGLPLISTNVGSCDEVVRSGVNGMIVPSGDADAIVRAIERLIRDPGLRATMSTQSRVVAQDFSIDHSAEKHLQLYELVCRESGR